MVAENKKENNQRDYQQDAITPSKLNKRRARSTTPDHSASSLSRSKTPEQKVGRTTPSTPQPSNKLGNRVQNESININMLNKCI